MISREVGLGVATRTLSTPIFPERTDSIRWIATGMDIPTGGLNGSSPHPKDAAGLVVANGVSEINHWRV